MNLKLALANTPDLSPRIVGLLVHSCSWCDGFLSFLNVQALVLLHRFNGLALNTLEQLFVCRDIMDQTDDLTSGPDLLLLSGLEHVA